MQEAVTGVWTWTQFLGFELASTKSSIIHICRRNSHEERNPVNTETGPIQIVKHARLLGVTFDGRFNWCQHISDTMENIECRERILRVIGGHRISGARGTLLDVHRALVESRLFYAWGIISLATPAAIRPIEPAHVAGIRSASGAFRSSPCKAIYAESGIPTTTTHHFTGCGIVYGVARTANRRPTHCSIFSAEAYAIVSALKLYSLILPA